VCLHGFMDSWRSWGLVLPALERHCDVLALTLPGHAGGPPLGADAGVEQLVDQLEQAIDRAGIGTAHLCGNSLGAYLALKLAERGRALSVVALAPVGGGASGDHSYEDLLARQRTVYEEISTNTAVALGSLATVVGRRRATELITTNFEHIPRELLEAQTLAVAGCTAAPMMIESALRDGWPLDASRVRCPVRIVWGTADKLLPWPAAAARFREELWHADWVVLDGIGHCPQLDVPVETAQLIVGFGA